MTGSRANAWAAGNASPVLIMFAASLSGNTSVRRAVFLSIVLLYNNVDCDVLPQWFEGNDDERDTCSHSLRDSRNVSVVD